MRVLLWAGRSLSTSATSFQSTTHEHEPRERCPRPLQGLALQSLPRTMRFSRCSILPLLDAKKIQARCAAASYAYSPTFGLESRTPKPREASPPRTTPIKWVRRAWETRRPKELSKGERARSCDGARPVGACAPRSLLVGSFEHLLSPIMRARRDGSPFACLYTSASSA